MSGSGFWSGGGGGGATPSLGKNWINVCQRTKQGNPLQNLHNVLLALRHDPVFAGRLRYDEMLRSVVTPINPIDDIQSYRIHEWLQDNGLQRVGIEVVREAIEIVAREDTFHPIRQWIESIPWDGSPRLSSWLSTYLGADDTEYHRAIGSMFLTAMIARIMQPGCQADYMIVLEGAQGELKSQCCRALAGKYFSDHLPPLGSDEVRLSAHLRGKWLIEISELSAFSRADASALKSFLTRQTEQFIHKYAHYESSEERQCCFIGTTNDDAYLKDETGGRRFWPVKCGSIDLEALRQDRNQLFAEALNAYLNGAQWWPDRAFERQHIAPVQDSRKWVDAWEEPITKFLEARFQVSLLEVATDLGIPKERFNRSEQLRVAAIMRSAGWQRKRIHGGYNVWVPGGPLP